MKLLAFALVLGIAAAPKVAAIETKPALDLKPKSAISLGMVASHRYAPFVSPAAEPELDLLPHGDERQDQSRSSCNTDRALCYDPNSGRIVYKPARQLMPEIPGLQRENISVKRDRVVLRYTF
jgi:hypothetical protein